MQMEMINRFVLCTDLLSTKFDLHIRFILHKRFNSFTFTVLNPVHYSLGNGYFWFLRSKCSLYAISDSTYVHCSDAVPIHATKSAVITRRLGLRTKINLPDFQDLVVSDCLCMYTAFEIFVQTKHDSYIR